jgi:hypothetical protein
MFAAPLVFADSLPSVNTETENINKNIFNADASSPYENREPMQLASRDSGGVSGIEMRKAIEEIQKNNNMEITNENNKTENSQEFISMDVPDSDSSNTGFKSYMDYRAITNKRSDQYQFQQEAITDENGFRVYDDCKMVAMGTYYVDKIGDKFRITLEDDTVFYAIAGDVKSDLHTDTKHQHKNGNIVEFIVDTQEISKTCKKMGDMSYAGLNGKIKSIEKVIENNNSR